MSVCVRVCVQYSIMRVHHKQYDNITEKREEMYDVTQIKEDLPVEYDNAVI